MLCSESLKRKRSEAAKKRWANPEFKARMAVISAKWKKLKPESKPCACGCGELANPGNKFLLGHNAKVVPPMFGKTHSIETKEKLRKASTGKPSAMKGKQFPEEVCKKMSRAHKGVPLSKKHCKSIGKRSKIVWASKTKTERKQWARNISKGEKGKFVSEESNKKNSEAKKRAWQDPAYARKCLVFNSPNKCEIKLLNILESMYPGEWKFVGDGQVVIAGKCPDFVNVNGQKKIIELFGEFWHKDDEPEKRANVFKPFGYETLVIWVKELSATRRLKTKLQSFCEEI